MTTSTIISTVVAVVNIGALIYLGNRANRLSQVGSSAQLVSVLWAEYDRVTAIRTRASEWMMVPVLIDQAKEKDSLDDVYKVVAERGSLPSGIDKAAEDLLQDAFMLLLRTISKDAWREDRLSALKASQMFQKALESYIRIGFTRISEIRDDIEASKQSLRNMTRRKRF